MSGPAQVDKFPKQTKQYMLYLALRYSCEDVLNNVVSKKIIDLNQLKSQCFQVQLVTYGDLLGFFIHLRYILQIPRKRSIVFLKS